jgi:hypothetical protein
MIIKWACRTCSNLLEAEWHPTLHKADTDAHAIWKGLLPTQKHEAGG